MLKAEKVQTFLEVAKTIGKLGTCDRAQVGAVLVRDGRAISWGYNGAPPGAPHCDENMHGWAGDTMPNASLANLGCRNTTHAEANAIAFAARQGISTEGASLYVERSPCLTCAHLCIAAGIVTVYYDVEYRDTAGVDALHRSCIPAYHVREDGTVVRHIRL